MTNIVWEKLRYEIGERGIEIHTIKKIGEVGLWFKVIADRDRVVVNKTKNKIPSIKISQPRIISFNEFDRISKLI